MQIDSWIMRIPERQERNLEEENTVRIGSEQRFGWERVEFSALLRILEVVEQVSPTRATVLLRGESGTGKEVIAKAIHQLSPRAKAPMITVHCAALNTNLLESELFGHEKGAFTGANERRIGRFEQAHGGTLFLDEIGEIDASIQVKLLRFLGERTFERVGSSKTLSADVRLITATNKDLEKMVKEGTFREDLFFRLRVVEIMMPPLRNRSEDIPLLAVKFLKEFSKENQKAVTHLSRDALELLRRYPWPGNVRELRACLEHAVIFASGSAVQIRDLPPSVKEWRPQRQTESGAPGKARSESVSEHRFEGGDFPASLPSVKEAEKLLIMRALEESFGNRTRAAEKLGISRRTLHRKLREYQLQKE
jgi:DNA-binding NtrC family response regulator